MASASRRSPSGVDVPCGLMRSISSRGTPWRSRAISMARRDAVALLDGLDEVPGIGGVAVAHDLGVDACAARLGELEVLDDRGRRRPRPARSRRGSGRRAARCPRAAGPRAACPCRACWRSRCSRPRRAASPWRRRWRPRSRRGGCPRPPRRCCACPSSRPSRCTCWGPWRRARWRSGRTRCRAACWR